MSTSYRHVIRILDTDLKGDEKLAYALARIRGIGINTSYAILKICNINPEIRVGYLQDSDVKKIEETLLNLPSYLPPYMLNRRKDLLTGKNLHLLGSDLVLSMKMDIDLMKKIKCWKGIRHALGLKVRGQCTRTTGRFGTTVGVVRKSVQQQQQQKKEKEK
ncbi:MAG: 30S ribosomal protein S13 [Candidatus Methanomethylicota archaeon]|uniref:Small ribosomal subunit protein uS13 n=1 Tax=Thermoproteota archaeon TaxID=2056631 RepID=A0A523BBT4_9CREN|nr:MAG: 30S ribosomal protein S13 [Candidatus Verstraetearchaeota archaeon]TDA38416.1 MAG: 30S ribosomal protein S13 [Candidatus Verstraetearchaeota archaeon]